MALLTAVADKLASELLRFDEAEIHRQERAMARVLENENARLEAWSAELSRAYAELKDAEVELVQSEKRASLGRLAAGVAHEINNPVSFIVSNIEPLRLRLERIASALPAEASKPLLEARRYIEIMARGAERTASVVRDLRSFSHLDEAPRKAVDLAEGLEVTIRLLEPRWHDRITIHRESGALRARFLLDRQLFAWLLDVDRSRHAEGVVGEQK